MVLTPSIDDSVYLIDENDINVIFKSDVKYPIKIEPIIFQTLFQYISNLNEFVLKHSLVVGSTGSGKSNTVAYLF